MASDKSTDFIKRNRPPRVNISYEDPYDSEKMVELPFVLGVMSDLSGNASEAGVLIQAHIARASLLVVGNGLRLLRK